MPWLPCQAQKHSLSDASLSVFFLLQVRNAAAMMATTGFLAVISMPVMLVVQRYPAVALWFLMPLMLGLAGAGGGIGGTIGAQIYPPAVRTSGFNLGYSL